MKVKKMVGIPNAQVEVTVTPPIGEAVTETITIDASGLSTVSVNLLEAGEPRRPSLLKQHRMKILDGRSPQVIPFAPSGNLPWTEVWRPILTSSTLKARIAAIAFKNNL